MNSGQKFTEIYVTDFKNQTVQLSTNARLQSIVFFPMIFLVFKIATARLQSIVSTSLQAFKLGGRKF